MRLSMIVPFLLLLSTTVAGQGSASAAGYHVEYSFNSANNSRTTPDGLLALGGKLYGTTGGGSLSNCKRKGGCGTVFSSTP